MEQLCMLKQSAIGKLVLFFELLEAVFEVSNVCLPSSATTVCIIHVCILQLATVGTYLTHSLYKYMYYVGVEQLRSHNIKSDYHCQRLILGWL